ncbi:MAG: PEGA domain-containing protein [Spirochaetales bacterium]|nr:PEGA domain-containing protein [Spirochaetales bacterium]
MTKPTIFKLFVLAGLLYASALPAQDLTWPTDWQAQIPTTWTWVCAQWQNPQGTPDGQSIRDAMAREFVQNWPEISTHFLDSEEIHLLQNSILTKARLALDKTITDYRNQQAEAEITNSAPPSTTAIQGWRDENQLWRQFREHPELVPLVNPMPLKFGGPSDGTVVSQVKPGAPADMSQALNADLMFWGILHSQGKIWHLEIGLWSRLENRNLMVWQDSFLPDEIHDRLEKAHNAFQTLFLGRAWASLTIHAQPASVLYRIDQKSYGNPLVLRDLQPGPLTVEAEAPGYLRMTKTLNLAANKMTNLTWSLKQSSASPISIETTPEGADVWVDSRWVGKTPVKVPSPTTKAHLQIELDHYESISSSITQGQKDLSFLLLPAQPKPDLQKAKDQFYLSLAAFSFSLTSTILARAFSDQWTALTNQYAAQYTSNSNPIVYANYSQAYQWAQNFRYGAYGGLVLTTGVFVWMMMELSAYIHVAETQ